MVPCNNTINTNINYLYLPWMVSKGVGVEGATGKVAESPTKGMRRGGGTGGVEGKLR